MKRRQVYEKQKDIVITSYSIHYTKLYEMITESEEVATAFRAGALAVSTSTMKLWEQGAIDGK